MKNKLVCGVGVNDADYKVSSRKIVSYTEEGEEIQKRVLCPFYQTWVDMLKRCYNQEVKIKHPTYQQCTLMTEWKSFMTFRSWMQAQDWEGNFLDKDILLPGNKVYGPDTCIFVSRAVNNFLTDHENKRGEWPIGVDFYKRVNKFRAQCREVISGKKKHLGVYETPEEAHQVYRKFKREQTIILASMQTDTRVAQALLDRY